MKRPSKRTLITIGITATILLIGIGMLGFWFSSSMLLNPSFKGLGKDFASCTTESQKYFGPSCGDLHKTRQFTFTDVQIPSPNGYNLPGWLIKAADNGKPVAHGAIMLAHAGGSDRREDTRHIDLYLSQGLDVLTFDQSCQGQAPCPVKGMSYGQRESRNIIGAYLYLATRYNHIYAMGSSVGASAILTSLPMMPGLEGVIAENPYTSFDRLIREAPESASMPRWAVTLIVDLAATRGHFDTLASPEHSLKLTRTTPILFIHSKADKVASYRQTVDLASLYDGPKTTWFTDQGEHALILEADPAAYKTKIADFLTSTR